MMRRTHSRSARAGSRIAVFTVRGDLHALLLKARLREQFGVACHIIETEELAHSGDMSWNPDGAWLLDADGERVDLETVDLVWWRRCNRQRGYRSEAIEARIISRSAADALHGLVWTHFSGTLLDDPSAVYRSENKLVQLASAKRAGLIVPATLVSTHVKEIRAFAEGSPTGVVLKAVRGTHDRALETVELPPEGLADEAAQAALASCPSIYQELVPGTDHLRILALHDLALAVRIHSERLDWRTDARITASAYELDRGTACALARLLTELGLHMGVVDMKLTPNGPMFLEINPQGQFVFAEGLSGVDLMGPFAAYVAELALEHHGSSCVNANSS